MKNWSKDSAICEGCGCYGLAHSFYQGSCPVDTEKVKNHQDEWWPWLRDSSITKECLMDPQANLEEQLALANAILTGNAGLGEDLAKLVIELDGWVMSGGFIPPRWLLRDASI